MSSNGADTACPHCKKQIAPETWIKRGSRLMAKSSPGNRMRNLRTCPHCGLECGAREMREHIPLCLQRPAEVSAEMRQAELTAMSMPVGAKKTSKASSRTQK